jgi:arginase family enzyme
LIWTCTIPRRRGPNGYAAPNGLHPGDVHEVLRHVAEQVSITSATLPAWDPSYDSEDHMRDVALDLLQPFGQSDLVAAVRDGRHG